MRFAVILSLLILVTNLYGLSPDQDELQWRELAPKKEEFTMRFPANNFFENRFKYKKRLVGTYRAVWNNTYFFVFTNGNMNRSPLREILSLAYENHATESILKVSGYNGKRFSFKGDDGFFHQLEVFLTRKRMYIFHIASETENTKITDELLGSIRFDRRIKTKKLLKLNDIGTFISTKKTISSSPTFFASKKENAFQAVGPSLPVASVPRKSGVENITSRLKILSKPRPGYTELARIYSISGNVILAVIFTKEGRIGEITVKKRLPFGLTKAAIRAARKIRFTPPYRDGKPYSVKKMVHFNFVIY